MTVRFAKPADLELLPAVELAADTVFAQVGMDLPADAASVEDLRAAEFVLVAGDPITGFAAVDRVDGQAHLAQLSVHPDAGRQGIGSALLAAVVRECTARGDAELLLTTYADVPWNGPFYRRRGFVPVTDPGPELTRHIADLAPWERFGPREALVLRLQGSSRDRVDSGSRHRQNGWPEGSV